MQFFACVLACTICICIGNCGGDQKTLVDCARYGKAYMVTGGAITCEVKKGGAV